MGFYNVFSRSISITKFFHNNDSTSPWSFLPVLLLFTEILINYEIYEMSIFEPLNNALQYFAVSL